MPGEKSRKAKAHGINRNFLVTLIVLIIVAGVFIYYYVTTSRNISTKNDQISDYSQQTQTLQDQLTSANSQISSLQAQISSLQSQLSSANSEVSSVQAQLSSAQSQLDAVLDTKVAQYYTFTYQSHQYDWTLSIPLRTYFYYEDKPRLVDSSKYSLMTTDSYADSLINIIVGELKDATLTRDLGKADIINMVAAFTQSLVHTDKDTTTPYDDYPCYPIETLFQQGGDSEDNSILAAAILSRLDYNVVFFVFTQPKHVAIGIDITAYSNLTSWEYQAKRYVYLETTGDINWQLGSCPSVYIGTQPTIIPIAK